MMIRSENVGEFTRIGPTPSVFSSLSWLKKDKKKLVLDYFGNRFGVPAHFFSSCRLYERGKAYWAISDSSWIDTLGNLAVESAGIMILRKLDEGVKPTTVALQLLGNLITKNVVTLEFEELLDLIVHKTMKTKIGADEVSRGYVAIRVGEYVVGCAYYRKGELISQLPKSFSSIHPRASELL